MTHYATLGVAQDAPPEVIKAAYRVLAQRYHPDKPEGSHARASALNEAYRILSDRTLRAAYDATLTTAGAAAPPAPRYTYSPQPSAAPPRSSAPKRVQGSAAGHAYTLTTRVGTIIDNQQWVEQKIHSRGGGGVTMFGFGYNRSPKISTTNIGRQRIAVRFGGHDGFLDHTGDFVPVAAGQHVEIVYAEGAGKSPWPVAIVNRSIGQWYWLDRGAGASIMSFGAQIVDGLSYAAVVGGIGALAWYGFVKQANIFVWAAFFLLGLPMLVGAAYPVACRTAWRITNAMERQIAGIAMAPA